MLAPNELVFTALPSDENYSVCLSNVCIVTKRKKDLSRFLYCAKII